VRPIVAFAAGAVVGGLIVLLLVGLPPAQRSRAGAIWRERAEQSERDLAAARRQLETVAAELGQLSERFEALTARFEALQVPPPATPLPAP
jgi:hypothetical protein